MSPFTHNISCHYQFDEINGTSIMPVGDVSSE